MHVAESVSFGGKKCSMEVKPDQRPWECPAQCGGASIPQQDGKMRLRESQNGGGWQ